MTERSEPLVSVRNLKKHYPIREGIFSKQVGAAKAVDGISFDIQPGETLGLVGESGCGKSTAASSIIRLEESTDGEVIFNGGGRGGRTRNEDGTHPNDVTKFDERELKAFRRDAQMIFQDPSSSFDPRMTVGSSVAELLQVHGMSDRERRRAIVQDLLERVGLSADDYDRYPHEFSGGQKQRIALARALVLNPEFIVADEPVSALDVSIKSEILSLINDLQEEFGLSLLFISHDMSVIREVCDRVAVMYLGEIVEIGETEELFSNPAHPYTEALLSAIPTPDPRVTKEGIELKGTVPSPSDPPSGCRFNTRCHRVLQSDEYDLEQSVWRSVLNFRNRTLGREIDVESVRKFVAAEQDVDPETVSADAVKSEIRAEFELPDRLSDPDAERVLDEALDHVAAEEAEEAIEMLSEVFTTPCEETAPEFVEIGRGHRSACLRNEPDAPGESIAAPNDD
ncbi:ATP-binding cassette domain-containing protein [Halorussus salilacus]|uniref:ABC transporter ATP-binding protein n=1 Tax=Halorussus salilacus TaxID=2953750 RepID=UPI00209ED7B6|nr:oligopeptide/dipeptide ABC transporter ATP-binding protein [Halorussus salilacus]USZ68798.1 ATP-binding cassette domain-containing protein [Halorussus salilacus]